MNVLSDFFWDAKALVYRGLYTLLGLQAKAFSEEEIAGSCLVVAPHPDDDVLGCSSIILAFRKKGLPVHIVYVTDGSASNKSEIVTEEKLALLRQEEAISGVGVLDVDKENLTFLAFRDGQTKAQEEMVTEKLVCLLKTFPATMVFTPCPYDVHSDHQVVSSIISKLKKQGIIGGAVYFYPIWCPWKKLIGFLLSGFASSSWRRMSLSDVRGMKKKAFEKHVSQWKNITSEESWRPLQKRFLARFFDVYELFLEDKNHS
jgi:LmbE family N-acetylglucosaminyl deacetylase